MDIIKYERIPFPVFIVINGLLLGLAILLVAVRVVIQIHSYGKLHPDDFVLLFACLTFIASQTLLYTLEIQNLYWLMEFLYNIADPQVLASLNGKNPGAIFHQIQRIDAASTALTWTSIFAVKICFLLFFYPLVTRLFRKWVLAWRIIFGITILVGVFCISSGFIACPHFGKTALKCSQDRGPLIKVLSITILIVILDIISDLLLISIPLILLWKVKIKRQQKIFFGIFLCLSVCMIIIAIVRVSGFTILLIRYHTIDPVWVLFWHQVEGAVAIITVSITAFRSLLGIKALKAREKEKRERSWFSHHQKLLRARHFQKKSTQDEPMSGRQLPSIPAATLTGIRTFIPGNGILGNSKPMAMTHNSDEDLPRVQASHEPQEIIVAQLSTELDLLDRVNSTETANFV